MHPAIVDMTGKRFSRWTVLGLDESNPGSGAHWFVRCECGSVRSVHGSHLRNGSSQSCGCLIREKGRPGIGRPIKDRVGERHGRLVIVAMAPRVPGRKPDWVCDCDCGSKGVIARGDALASHRVNSCGCLKRESSQAKGKWLSENYKPPILLGPDHPQYGKFMDDSVNWKGEEISYVTAHSRVKNHFGPASQHECVDCGDQAHHWAYQHRCPNEAYSTNNNCVGAPYCPAGWRAHPDCMKPMCRSCHKAVDSERKRASA